MSYKKQHSHINLGKTTLDVKFVEEDIDYRNFFKPKKQGEVDTARGKPEVPKYVVSFKKREKLLLLNY